MATRVYFNDLLQHCSNSIANALELLQSYAKPLIFMLFIYICQKNIIGFNLC